MSLCRPSCHTSPGLQRVGALVAACGCVGCIFLSVVILVGIVVFRLIVKVSETPIEKLVGVEVFGQCLVVPLSESHVILDDEFSLLLLGQLVGSHDDCRGVCEPCFPIIAEVLPFCFGLLCVAFAAISQHHIDFRRGFLGDCG